MEFAGLLACGVSGYAVLVSCIPITPHLRIRVRGGTGGLAAPRGPDEPIEESTRFFFFISYGDLLLTETFWLRSNSFLFNFTFFGDHFSLHKSFLSNTSFLFGYVAILFFFIYFLRKPIFTTQIFFN